MRAVIVGLLVAACATSKPAAPPRQPLPMTQTTTLHFDLRSLRVIYIGRAISDRERLDCGAIFYSNTVTTSERRP